MSEQAIVDAIHDLTRVIIAVNGKFPTRSDAIRALHALSIPGARIAAILAIDINTVTSALAKEKKRQTRNRETHASRKNGESR